MKSSFFVCIEIVFALVFLFLCGIGSFIWFAIDAFREDFALSLILTLMLAVLPTVLLIWGVCLFASKIYIDETGITKRLFGLKLNYFNWNEIEFVKHNGNGEFILSLSFYKRRKDNVRFLRFYKNERIYFCCNAKKLAIVNNYAPENIKKQLNNKTDKYF